MIFKNLNIFSISLFIFLVLILIFLFIFYTKRYKKNSKKYFLAYKNKSFKKYFLANLSLFLAIFILLFGIFEIKYTKKTNSLKVKGIDIVFVLDVSKSMNAKVTESKTSLEIAKDMIKNYIAKHNYNRYSLVIFSGNAMSICPLTTDYSIFLSFLKNVDYSNLSKLGTDFTNAIEFGLKRFSKDSNNSKAIIFISDGADKDTKINWEKIKELKKPGVFIGVIGIGSKSGAKILEGYDAFGDPIYTKYNGKDVKVRLNEANLKKLAKILSGEYYSSLGDIDKNLDLLEKKVILKAESKYLGDFKRILIMISFVFFLIYLVIIIRKISP